MSLPSQSERIPGCEHEYPEMQTIQPKAKTGIRQTLASDLSGEKVARDYRKYYGVDWPTAFKELEMLGVEIPVDYRETVLKNLASLTVAKEQKQAEKLALENPE